MVNPCDVMDLSVCLYHGGCPDGIGAAYPIWRIYPNMQFIPVNYGKNPPWEKITGKNIIIVDFSYKKNTMRRICERANYVILLDHHESASDELDDFHAHNCYVNIQVGVAASELAWRHFFPTNPIPWFIQYICDMDLYKWALPNSKLIHTFMSKMNWYNWEKMEEMYMSMIPPSVQMQNVLLQAEVFLTMKEKDIKVIARKCIICDFIGYKVTLVHAVGDLISDIGNYLAVNYDCDFAAVWRYHIVEDEWRISLRGIREDINLAKIAETFGGGGHKKAAGFKLNEPIRNWFTPRKL